MMLSSLQLRERQSFARRAHDDPRNSKVEPIGIGSWDSEMDEPLSKAGSIWLQVAGGLDRGAMNVRFA